MTSPEPPSSQELAGLNEALMHGTLEQRAAAADRLAEIRSAVPVDFVHHVNDRLWTRVGPIGADLMESSGADPRNNVPTATIKVKGTSDLVEHFMGCEQTLVGVEVEVGGLNFPFYVRSHDWEYEKGAYTSTLNCRGIWDILNYLRIWPVWWLPIQFQPFSHAVFFAPLCTLIENMISECAIRIQSGINEFLNNALSLNPDLRAWIGTLLQSNGNIFTALKTPIYVVRTNPFLDSSPLFAKTVRMESCGTVITDITRPYGVDVRVDLWRPGMPQPDPWANLTQVTYVVTVKDRSQIEGPTKTILDSALRTAVDLQGSLLGNLLAPLLNPQGQYAPEGVYIAPSLGLNFVRPLVVIVAPRPGEENPRTPLLKMKVSQHTPMGWNHIIGGKSPRWLVCAPQANTRGAQTNHHKHIQRPHQRVPVMDRRRDHDPDRNHRNPFGSALRVPQRRNHGVPAHPTLRPAQRRRPIPPGHRGIHPDKLRALQHRGPVHVHHRVLGFTRLHLGAIGDPPRRGGGAGTRPSPRRPGVTDL